MSPINLVSVVRGINKIQPSVISRKDWIKYLSVRDILVKEIGEEFVKGDPGKEFGEVVSKIVNDYMFNNKMPPGAIAPAIYNIVDDCMSGREPILRAGDYISLQNYVRKQVST
ncbi:MAG: hypothetical protein ACYC6G_02190 [Desulfobaccales bacterium]